MSKLAKALTAAAGNAAGESLYVEDVFSTYLYDGTGADQTITNGINLSEEGGLVWLKNRGPNYTGSNTLYDTERGGDYRLETNSTGASADVSALGAGVTFNTDGFIVKGNHNNTNRSGDNAASWTFRKAEKFFDIVTYTGDGSVQSIAHNLGSVPKCMIVKKTSNTGDWYVYHIDLGAGINGRKTLKLDSTAAQSDSGGFSDHPTSTEFTVNYAANTSGETYVAYLFASDAGGFGDDGSENIIKCGSYTSTGNSVTGIDIDLGFEPQWILQKNATGTSSTYWMIADVMRGLIAKDGSSYPDVQVLKPNTSDTESDPSILSINSTGFTSHGGFNNGDKIIYIAIRRPMKTPESGTEVFAIDTLGGTAPNPPGFNGVLVDWSWKRVKNTLDDWYSQSRLTGTNEMKLNETDTESSVFNILFDYQDGWLDSSATLSTQLSWMFKRATGFFDVVAYTGDGVVGSTQAHNLGVAPEMMIVKVRNQQNFWHMYHKDLTSGHTVYLNATYASSSQTNIFNSTDPTDSVFTLGSASASNYSGYTYIAYLFATLDGVSKVGSYTGTGSNVNVDCGFSAGARFVMIKRTDSTGDWYVWDSVRGIVAGNDPYLLINSTAPEVTSTDYIDPLASGFTVTSSAPAALNTSGGTYIFLAIA